jgi:hypothetical protein
MNLTGIRHRRRSGCSPPMRFALRPSGRCKGAELSSSAATRSANCSARLWMTTRWCANHWQRVSRNWRVDVLLAESSTEALALLAAGERRQGNIGGGISAAEHVEAQVTDLSMPGIGGPALIGAGPKGLVQSGRVCRTSGASSDSGNCKCDVQTIWGTIYIIGCLSRAIRILTKEDFAVLLAVRRKGGCSEGADQSPRDASRSASSSAIVRAASL